MRLTGTAALNDITQNNSTMGLLNNTAHGKSFISQATNKSTKEYKGGDKQNGVLALYKKFERLYEMDVVYTL